MNVLVAERWIVLVLPFLALLSTIKIKRLRKFWAWFLIVLVTQMGVERLLAERGMNHDIVYASIFFVSLRLGQMVHGWQVSLSNSTLKISLKLFSILTLTLNAFFWLYVWGRLASQIVARFH